MLCHVHAHGCTYGNRRGTWGRLQGRNTGGKLRLDGNNRSRCQCGRKLCNVFPCGIFGGRQDGSGSSAGQFQLHTAVFHLVAVIGSCGNNHFFPGIGPGGLHGNSAVAVGIRHSDLGRLVCQGHKGRKGNALRTQILSIECRRDRELIASRLGRRGFQLSCEARSGDLYDHVLDFSPGLGAGFGHGDDHGIAYRPGGHGSLNIGNSGIFRCAVTAQFHRNGMLLGVEIGDELNIRIGHFERAGKAFVQGDRLNGVLLCPGGPVAQGHVYGGVATTCSTNGHGHIFSNLHKLCVGKVCYRNSTHSCIRCTVFLHLGGDGLFVYRKDAPMRITVPATRPSSCASFR